MKTTLSRPQTANVPVPVVQQTISDAMSVLFGQETVYCERHSSDHEAVIVMIANGICVTLHVQETAHALQKGVAV